MRIFALVFITLLWLLFSTTALPRSASESLTLFPTEQKAQHHCPEDEVVWLNIKTGIWHVQGARWYGSTKNGAYVCKQEAADAGNRQSLNG